ncbi:hypothetical protein JYG23_06615 [Sedimentibacter sp. zth1]|uniref:hypothetical protein n=1 Tax=Sedimentibacter sp. zth1 TaxID=2816908 RepID=UPI001A92F0EC|nr:hypothetical protein [Sedimentibacter sp. zth1]QSX07054.1 hypothetical protein JYG23_06615 [Sedimentibacter sp. zth1]
MENDMLEILNNVSNKKCNVDNAIKKISNITFKENIVSNDKIQYAKKIKIYINVIDDKKDGKRLKINLPAISLKFLKRVGMFGIKIASKYSKNDNKNSNQNEHIKNMSFNDLENIKYVFDALVMLPPFEIINVDSNDAKVHIYTC